nr:hypothetical protein [Tanacetum cinerariifolium]
MPSLFADTHNVVAILEKSDTAEGFVQIIDFLSGSYIHYALTVSDVTRLQALVDKKKIVISEDVIREILRLNDADGVNEFSTAMASAVICLSKGQRFNFSRVGKGFSWVETPLFENMLAVRDVDAEEEVQVSAQGEDIQENATEQLAADVVQPTPTS